MKIEFRNGIKRIGSLISAGFVLMSSGIAFSGCSTKDVNDDVAYVVEDSDYEYDNGRYNYVINKKGFESSEHDFENSYRMINFAKVQQFEEYGTNFFNQMSDATNRSNIKLVKPDCYALYSDSVFSQSRSFDIDIKYEKVQELSGNEYIIVYSSATAKHDIKLDKITNFQRQIQKGDNFSSTAVYFDDELVAYKQTGAGSECLNIQKSYVGDVDLAISTVEDKGLLNQSENISSEELYNIQESMNEKQKVLTLR